MSRHRMRARRQRAQRRVTWRRCAARNIAAGAALFAAADLVARSARHPDFAAHLLERAHENIGEGTIALAISFGRRGGKTAAAAAHAEAARQAGVRVLAR